VLGHDLQTPAGWSENRTGRERKSKEQVGF
jgi:hypothetical protein